MLTNPQVSSALKLLNHYLKISNDMLETQLSAQYTADCSLPSLSSLMSQGLLFTVTVVISAITAVHIHFLL